MSQNMGNGNKPGDASALDQYELEHLARKFGVHARLAKAGHVVQRETRVDVEEHGGPVRKTRA